MAVCARLQFSNSWYGIGSRPSALFKLGISSYSKHVTRDDSFSPLIYRTPPKLVECYLSRSLCSSVTKPDESKGKLIYTGGVSRAVKFVKLFSLSTSLIGVCIQPWLFAELQTSNIAFKVATLFASSFFIFITPVLLHFLCKRYVIRMYFNEENRTFTAVRYNLIAKEKEFIFKPEEVQISVPSPFSNFKVKEQSFLLDSDQLRETHPEVYIAFMKYDKPLDVKEYFKDIKK